MIKASEGEKLKGLFPWDNDKCCLNAVDEIFQVVDSLELDKQVHFICIRSSLLKFFIKSSYFSRQLLANLRELKSILTGDMLEQGVRTVRAALRPELSRKIEVGGSSRISSIVKSLLQIGANLSQSREFRDLFEDLLTKVGVG